MDFGGALLPHPALVLSLQLKQAGRIEQVHRSAGVQLEKERSAAWTTGTASPSTSTRAALRTVSACHALEGKRMSHRIGPAGYAMIMRMTPGSGSSASPLWKVAGRPFAVKDWASAAAWRKGQSTRMSTSLVARTTPRVMTAKPPITA